MDIIDYLPQKMKAEAEAYMPCGLEEIRVRAGKQVQYMFAGGCRAGVYISHSDIEEMINYLSAKQRKRLKRRFEYSVMFSMNLELTTKRAIRLRFVMSSLMLLYQLELLKFKKSLMMNMLWY